MLHEIIIYSPYWIAGLIGLIVISTIVVSKRKQKNPRPIDLGVGPDTRYLDIDEKVKTGRRSGRSRSSGTDHTLTGSTGISSVGGFGDGGGGSCGGGFGGGCM